MITNRSNNYPDQTRRLDLVKSENRSIYMSYAQAEWRKEFGRDWQLVGSPR